MRRPRELSRFRAPWALVAALVAPLAAADGGADPAPAAPPNVVGSAVDPWAELDRDLERPAQRLLRRPEEAAAPAERPLAPRARGWMRTGGALAGVVAIILLLAWSLRAALLGNLTIARGRRRRIDLPRRGRRPQRQQPAQRQSPAPQGPAPPRRCPLSWQEPSLAVPQGARR